MQKTLFYAMRGEKMCFLHVLMNALALHDAGHTVSVIMEGESVRLVKALQDNPLMMKAREKGLVAGVCKACSQQLGVLKENEESGLTLLSDMNGHAGMAPYVTEGYMVVSM